MIALDVIGIPKALARPRAFSRGGHADVYSPPNDWVSTVQLAVLALRVKRAFDEPCAVTMLFRMRRITSLPKRREVPHTSKPDLDNLVKGTLDALVPRLLASDALVTKLEAQKRYALTGEPPGCLIVIAPAAQSDKEANHDTHIAV